MPAKSQSRSKNDAGHGSRGFTLVELLAVMLILTILLALVVGASRMIFQDVEREETLGTMRVIMSAISQYYETSDPKAYPYPDDSGGSKNDWVKMLASNAEARKQIAGLGKSVWDPSKAAYFLDAWGNEIRYYRSAGLGGAPGLRSGGPDGKLLTTDDVRSDE